MVVLNPLFGLLYLIGLGLDILMFFLWVHILLAWRPIFWLVPLGQIGKPLVETLLLSVDTYLKEHLHLHFNKKALAPLVLLIIFTIKLLLTCLLRI